MAAESNNNSKCESEKHEDNVVISKPSEPESLISNIGDSRPSLVLVNPRSGKGKSLKIYKKNLSKILKSHNIMHEVFVTTADIRVKDYLGPKNLDELRSYRSIIVVSGDGLLFETVNAIMSRPDWGEVIKIPFGIIPTGSGNGLAYTLIKQSTRCVNSKTEAIQYCCEQAVQSKSCTSDLVRIQYGGDKIIWSFLSIGWGLLANIDVDSDWLRRLGELRFTLYGLFRALTCKSRRGKLSYQHYGSSEVANKSGSLADKASSTNELATSAVGGCTSDSKEDASMSSWTHIEDRFACLYAVHQSHVSRVTNFAPKSTLTDNLMYLTYVRGNLSPCQVVEYLLAIKDGSHDKLPYVRVVPVRKFSFQPMEPSKIVVDGEIIPWDLSQGPLTAEVFPGVLNLLWSRDPS